MEETEIGIHTIVGHGPNFGKTIVPSPFHIPRKVGLIIMFCGDIFCKGCIKGGVEMKRKR